jgi:hypothetical protein
VEYCAVGGRVPWVIALVGAEGEPSHRGGEATLTIDCAVESLSCPCVYVVRDSPCKAHGTGMTLPPVSPGEWLVSQANNGRADSSAGEPELVEVVPPRGCSLVISPVPPLVKLAQCEVRVMMLAALISRGAVNSFPRHPVCSVRRIPDAIHRGHTSPVSEPATICG